MTGTDSVYDHWSPFGRADMLEKPNFYAHLYRGSDEFRPSRALAIATGGVLPLDDGGKMAWRRVGDAADFTLVPPSCSAEAVARLSERSTAFQHGRMVYSSVASA